MKKLFLSLLFLTSFTFFGQSNAQNKALFVNNSSLLYFQFSKKDNLSEYQKYFNSPTEFSIYNPKPGFYPTKIQTQKYYSFTNTKLLLKREMQNKEPEPIYPNQDKKKTFGETVFHDVLDGIFSKK